MKIFITGTRGIPDIPGGVEKHCQMLYPILAKKGHDVILANRTCYVKTTLSSFNQVKLVQCFAPKKKNFEAIVHTFLSIIKALRYSPDILHIHAIGPSLLTPFARLLGFKIVVTHHGPDYRRQKWGWFAKTILKLGELSGGIFAHEIICISSEIKELIWNKCHKQAHLIPNGVFISRPAKDAGQLKKIGIIPKKYVLAVSRFVPEKGLHDLINAFCGMDTDRQLVIAGDADHETEYSRYIKALASKDDRIVLTGYISGDTLLQVYSHAQLFVLPSYYEGHPIALLEAMSYGLDVLVSDIKANREIELPQDRYFKCGQVQDLHEKIKDRLNKKKDIHRCPELWLDILAKYDWNQIAKQTIMVYETAKK